MLQGGRLRDGAYHVAADDFGGAAIGGGCTVVWALETFDIHTGHEDDGEVRVEDVGGESGDGFRACIGGDAVEGCMVENDVPKMGEVLWRIRCRWVWGE